MREPVGFKKPAPLYAGQRGHPAALVQREPLPEEGAQLRARAPAPVPHAFRCQPAVYLPAAKGNKRPPPGRQTNMAVNFLALSI
eukprot:8334375-Pyramimonas_sp.AAC.2